MKDFFALGLETLSALSDLRSVSIIGPLQTMVCKKLMIGCVTMLQYLFCIIIGSLQRMLCKKPMVSCVTINSSWQPRMIREVDEASEMIALQLRHNTTTNNKTMPLQFICKCIQGLRNPVLQWKQDLYPVKDQLLASWFWVPCRLVRQNGPNGRFLD